MARKSEITPESVAAAAAKLTARGQAVTNKSVLAEIGSGSMSTLVPLLAAYKAAQEEGAELAEIEVPDQITVAGEQLMSRVWKAAMQEATAGHDALRRDLLASRAEKDALRADMVELLASAEAERDLAQERGEVLGRDLENSEKDAKAYLSRAIDAERELAAARERSASADARADRAEADRAEALDHAKQIEAEVVQLRDAAAVLRETVAKLTAQSSALADQLKTANSAATAADARATKAEARAEKAEGKAEAVQIELNKTGVDLGGARSDLAKERAEHAATRNQLQDRLERLSVDLDNSRDAEKDAKKDAATSRKERDEAVAAQAKLAARIQELELLAQKSGKE